jgi:hypothetical protein
MIDNIPVTIEKCKQGKSELRVNFDDNTAVIYASSEKEIEKGLELLKHKGFIIDSITNNFEVI